MTSKEDLIKLKEVFLEIKQWWLKDDKEKLTEWQEKTFDNAIKDLEVLEILKNKRVDISILALCGTVEEYNNAYIRNLTQEEFDLIKEWLDNDK